MPGAGGSDYAAPPGWETGHSVLLRIEYPSGQTDPIFLPHDEAEMQPTGIAGVERLRLRTVSPGTSETFNVLFTGRHGIASLLTDIDDAAAPTSTTLPSGLDDPLGDLAASYAFRLLMDREARTVDSSIRADATDQAGVFDRYARLAEQYEKSYGERLARLTPGAKYPGAYLRWGAGRRTLLFSKILTVSKGEPSYDRYNVFFQIAGS